MPRTISARIWAGLTSLKLSIVCLALLMILVVACTLQQTSMGLLPSVNRFIRSGLVWWELPGSNLSIPIFPGGGTVGFVLLVNLIAAQLKRLAFTWKKIGLWIVHAGLILLFFGEFVTSIFQVEMQLAIEQGQTLDYIESPRDVELAITDTTNPQHDDVYSVPESILARGGLFAVPGTPLTFQVHSFFLNAELAQRGPGAQPSPATRGVGPSVVVTQRRPVTSDDEINLRAAFVEPVAAGRSYGIWLVSNGLGAPQSFLHEGHNYVMQVRRRREYLPYSVTLKKFSHDIYPGTDIPKNFSSLVRLQNPTSGEARDVLIFMNQPLRFAGKTFYQASFGKGDTLSILQVVENPGWLIPYISCVLVALGLVLHFGLSLMRSSKRRDAAALGAA